ncbi:MAG: Xaa-Pro dipeptidase [Gammaproteobacteria bacterium]|nr:Xaa-Pro dipeptidase [Gammaproteobacteria bacterium]NNC96696.1 Xaa-Pro dipeptidase [Gammaproteobacteria bacterium]NNM13800.1 Xaa-Pro dipeptidase [Gammaproteobacteria bacterium]
MTPDVQNLYQAHATDLISQHQDLLKKYDFDAAVIPSGELQYVFQDDMSYPFKANAYFKWLVPLCKHPNCFMVIPQKGKPTLIYFVPRDYWHAVPEMPDENLFSAFDVQVISKAGAAQGLLPHTSGQIAWLGEAPQAFDLPKTASLLPEPLLSELHWLRAYKSEYEQHCLYQASLLGAKAHLAAKQAFYAGLSELQIHNAYLHAMGCKESNLPYGNIVALNEHAAVLHFTEMDNVVYDKSELRSFLIDAGGSFHGYASDITRTYAFQHNDFAEMIVALDQKQLEIVDAIEPGDSYIELHKLTHRKVAEILLEFNVLDCALDEALEKHITSTFFPHGLGHHLGLHVHDAGGHQETATGGSKLPPPPHDFLRNTRTIEAGNYFTIEPGLYFIPQLLGELKDSKHSGLVNWDKVEEFLPFGGIRIEDNVLVGENAVENFTRKAFAELNPA